MRNIITLIFSAIFASIVIVACVEYEEPVVFSQQERNVSSRYITPDEAYRCAVEAYKIFGFDVRSRSLRATNVRLYNDEASLSRKNDLDSTFYIVDFEGGGFAIIAADKKVQDRVFAISDKDKFDVTGNPELQLYMNTMSSLFTPIRVDSAKPQDFLDSVITHLINIKY